MKTLTIDIETSPNLAHVWSLWNTNVSLSQLLEAGEVICYAAKWYGSQRVMFSSVHHHGRAEMVKSAHELLEAADNVVHFNGARFDIPHLNREFVTAGLTPPAPYAQVDLLKVVKKNFRFVSNKLDHVVQQLGIGSKAAHTGHKLWVDCMSGDPKAWSLMRKYNRRDVTITEALYDRLKPWIPSHPNHRLYSGSEAAVCPNCGSERLTLQGKAYTSVSTYQRYKCGDCGKWSRGNRRLDSSDVTGVK